jgi:hypothetical protein
LRQKYRSFLQLKQTEGGTGYAGEDISMNNTSDSASINMDADAIFALYQLEGERELGRINVKILKNRLGGYVDTTFPMSVNYDTLKITDWDNSSEDSYEVNDMNTTDINNNAKLNTTESSEINDIFNQLGV